MSLAKIPVMLLLVLAGVITAFFTIIFWKNRKGTTGAVPIAVAMAAASLWAGSLAIPLISSADEPLYLTRALSIMMPALIAVAVFLLSLQIAGKLPRSIRPSVWILLLVPVAASPLLAISPQTPFTLQDAAGSPLAPVFWLFLLYDLILVLASLSFIIQSYRSASGIFRGQAACLLIAILIPVILHAAFIFQISPFQIIDLAPIGCIGSVIALAAGIERYSLFDIVPVDNAIPLMQLPAGIVVLDRAGRIVAINPAARLMLGTGDGDVIGSEARRFLPQDKVPLSSRLENALTVRRHMFQREIDGAACYIEIQCIPIHSLHKTQHGHIMLLSDITDQKLTEQSLNKARKNLNLLTSITRHDILNQLTVILLHNEILQETAKDPLVAKSLSEQDAAIKNIRRLIAFTKDYDKLGENVPQWIDIDTLVRKLISSLGYEYIHFSTHTEGLEVFADPLISKVFDNLFDNSLRYGQKVTHIRVFTTQHLNGLTIMYEDNGIGIPAKEKKQIFKRGTGRNTGFGLFFAREILSITGISISETGQESSGARFELMVPWGRFRFRRESSESALEQEET